MWCRQTLYKTISYVLLSWSFIHHESFAFTTTSTAHKVLQMNSLSRSNLYPISKTIRTAAFITQIYNTPDKDLDLDLEYDMVPYDDEEDDDDNEENETNEYDDDDDDDDDDDSDDMEEDSPHMQLHDALTLSLDKALKNLEKKTTSLQSEFDKAQQAELKLHRGNLITSNLYQITPTTTSITVQDWEKDDGADIVLELDTKKYSSFQEEAEDLFAVARKMKRGSIVVQELLEQSEKAVQILQKGQRDLQQLYREFDDSNDSVAFMEDLAVLQTTLEKSQKKTQFQFIHTSQSKQKPKQKRNQQTSSQRKQKQKQKPTLKTLKSPYSGLKIHIGRNRRANEYISLQMARGNDLWLHARGCPGAHVLVQQRRGDPPMTPKCLQLAANLAAFYSDARTERKAVITVAEPKHIQKPRGAPLGAVKIRQELKSVIGNPMDVPEELKAAREENGAYWGDEGGMRSLGGKVKNRKKTESVTKEKIAKKRAEKRSKNKRKNKGNSDGDGPRVVNGIVEGDWF